jgi:hypothetical protein
MAYFLLNVLSEPQVHLPISNHALTNARLIFLLQLFLLNIKYVLIFLGASVALNLLNLRGVIGAKLAERSE